MASLIGQTKAFMTLSNKLSVLNAQELHEAVFVVYFFD